MSQSYKVRYEGSKEKILSTLHPDDTVDTLKRKILLNVSDHIPYDSMYLYAVKRMKFVPEQLFKELTQNKKLELTHKRLHNFLLNFEEEGILEKIPRKDVYTIGDLYALRLDKLHDVRIPIGQRFLGNKATIYPYTVDPRLVKSEEDVDDFLLENASSMISTQNAMLVMDYGDIKDDTFYLITGEEIFKHFEDLSMPPMGAIYLPFLIKKEF